MRELVVSPYGQVFRCTALFPLAMLLRESTRLTISHGLLGLNLEESVLVRLMMPWVNLYMVIRTFR